MGAKPGKRRGIRRADNETLEPLSIRMSAKLKFGLELLARHQGRSVGQAIEWALQNSLAAVKVKNDSGEIIHHDSLLSILNQAWELSGWQRDVFLHYSNSGLVGFEVRHACELVRKSVEHRYLNQMSDALFEYFRIHNSVDEKNRRDYDDLDERMGELIGFAWPFLLEDANTLETTSRRIEDEPVSILEEFCFRRLADGGKFAPFDEADMRTRIVMLSDLLRARKGTSETAP